MHVYQIVCFITEMIDLELTVLDPDLSDYPQRVDGTTRASHRKLHMQSFRTQRHPAVRKGTKYNVTVYISTSSPLTSVLLLSGNCRISRKRGWGQDLLKGKKGKMSTFWGFLWGDLTRKGPSGFPCGGGGGVVETPCIRA